MRLLKRKLKKVGNSYYLLIPKDYVINGDLSVNAEYDITFEASILRKL